MSQHWRLAVGGAATVVALTVPCCVAIAHYFGGADAWSFLYGVGLGLVIFTLIAATVSNILRRPSEANIGLGFIIYFGRLVFAAAALAIPLLTGWMPVLPMVCGLVAVYVVENVALGPWIHVGSRVRNFAAARIGQEFTLRARVLSNTERKGHRLVELDALVLAEGAAPVARVLHTAIWRLRGAAAA